MPSSDDTRPSPRAAPCGMPMASSEAAGALASGASPVTPTVWYSWAIVRVVPRVERGECLNVGVVLFVRATRYLAARVELDAVRLQALAPWVDVALVERHLQAFAAIAAGAPEGGPLAALPPAERFHWLTAPRSTIIQTSSTHVGATADPAATLEALVRAYVRPPVA